MSIVKRRETYFVTSLMDAGTGKFTKNLNIGGDFDELRIVQVLYVPAAADIASQGGQADAVFRVAWDGVCESIFLFDLGHSMSNANIRVNVHGKVLNGQHSFTIYDVAGDVANNNVLTGELGFVFEAVKY